MDNVSTVSVEQPNGIQPPLILLFTPHLTGATMCQNVLCDKTLIITVTMDSDTFAAEAGVLI